MARHIPTYGVFIIESMDWDNEADGKLDGVALKTILDLCGIPNYYIYIRTTQELDHAIDLFRQTDYGFLHISCHGNEEGISLTLDDVSFEELNLIMGPSLKYRRLFLSACKAACFSLAEYFIPRHHCYSIMGAANTIDYDKAAIFWSSYYYLIYQVDSRQMWQKHIIPILQNITQTFGEELNYFSIIKEQHISAKHSLREIHFQNGIKTFDMVRKTRFENLYWKEAAQDNIGPYNISQDNTPSS